MKWFKAMSTAKPKKAKALRVERIVAQALWCGVLWSETGHYILEADSVAANATDQRKSIRSCSPHHEM